MRQLNLTGVFAGDALGDRGNEKGRGVHRRGLAARRSAGDDHAFAVLNRKPDVRHELRTVGVGRNQVGGRQRVGFELADGEGTSFGGDDVRVGQLCTTAVRQGGVD